MNTIAATPGPATDERVARARDTRVIGLVSLAHGFSHFYQLAFPVLFLMIRDEWQMSFADLGVVVTVFYVTSGLMQTAAGFLVDRIGAAGVLKCGLGLIAGGILLMGFAPNHAALLVCAVIAAVGNSVFHPADFGILNSAVAPKRLGPAFSAHGIAGNLGWAAAPATMTLLAAWFGWRGALITAGLCGLAVLVLLQVYGADLSRNIEKESGAPVPAASASSVLFTAPILSCFVFFSLLAAGIIGIQSFGLAVLGTTLGMTPHWAATTLTAFMLGGAAGILFGGALATRTARHGAVAGAGMLAAAILMALAASGGLPHASVIAALTAAGFLSGLTFPSRDLLVRSVCTRGNTGKVYGFVYSGLDAGSSVAPFLFGWLLDHQMGRGVFYFVSAAWLCTLITIYMMRKDA